MIGCDMMGDMVHARRNLLRFVTVLTLLAAPLSLLAQTPQTPASPQPTAEEARKKEARDAWNAASEAATKSPATIPLLTEAHLRLPPNMIYVPSAQAARLLRAWGNKVSADPVGLVLGTRDQDDWAVVIRFVKEGYIKDDDARDWKADELLSGIREGNESSNEDRRARGFTEIEIVGWITPPAYDATTHRLVYSLAQKQKGAPESTPEGVSFNTYALGRNGYFTLNLLTSRKTVDQDKIAAASLLSALDYDEGNRYTDFNASTDHVAAYGLAALVGVVAVKKLGLLALAGVFVLKFAKIGAIGLAALAFVGAKLFKRRPKPGA